MDICPGIVSASETTYSTLLSVCTSNRSTCSCNVQSIALNSTPFINYQHNGCLGFGCHGAFVVHYACKSKLHKTERPKDETNYIIICSTTFRVSVMVQELW
jgi:hypothetical protein